MTALKDFTAAWVSRLVSETASHDLTNRQLMVLLLLAEQGEPMTVSDVAEKANMPTPAASRAISALTDRGFVGNEVSKKDRRTREIALTAEGRTLARSIQGITRG